MKRSQASQTSSMVAMFRAAADAGLSHVAGFKDPTARHFLDGPWLRRLERTRRNRLLSEMMKYGADLLALRTLVIDEAVKAAVASGARQLVILGAGLDGRAFRMPELAGLRVFEVDHPATQALKRERAQTLTSMAAALTYVPVDFERDTLDAALQAAGHRPGEPTVWIWEGVVMYLTLEATRATLRIIGARSAKGSTLIVQYNTRERRAWLVAGILRWWGEPAIGLRTREEMASELATVGFAVREDTSAGDWGDKYGAPIRAQRGARIVTALR